MTYKCPLKKEDIVKNWWFYKFKVDILSFLADTDNTGKKQVPSGVEIDRRVTSTTVKRVGDVT